jgi:hypothetical protein
MAVIRGCPLLAFFSSVRFRLGSNVLGGEIKSLPDGL